MKKRPNNEINKIVGARWNALSQEKKKNFELQSDKDKERYLREVHEYNQKADNPLAPRLKAAGSFGQSIKTSTAYGQFATQDRSYILQLTNHSVNLGKYLSSRWQSIGPREKVMFENISEYTSKVTSSMHNPVSATAAAATTTTASTTTTVTTTTSANEVEPTSRKKLKIL